MIWKSIRDEQPKDGELIVQINRSERGDYVMGNITYFSRLVWEENVAICKKMMNCEPNNFWWVYAKDSPFNFSP